MRAARDRERRRRAARGRRDQRRAGPLVPSRDPEALADAITELCRLPHDRLADMGRAARGRVERVFSLARGRRAHRGRARGGRACSPSTSIGSGCAPVTGCSTPAAARGATASARSSAARTRWVSTSTPLPAHRARRHSRAARPRGREAARRRAARRRLPPALRGRRLRPRDLLRGDGARARLRRGGARARARAAPGRHARSHDPDRDHASASIWPPRAATSRARAATFASSSRAISRARWRARASRRRRRLRARVPLAVLAVRAFVGLDDERSAPTRAFRALLMRATFSRRWSRVERLLDWVWPKSLVLYGTHVATGRPEAAPCA